MQFRPFKTSLFVLLMGSILIFGSCEPSVKEKKRIDEKVDNHKRAQITWRDLSYIDTVKAGDTIIRDYIFYNSGWRPVQVLHAIPSRPECTCRVPGRDVLIGEQDTVRLTCIFPEPEPRASVQVIIEHNTPQPEMTLLYITTVEE